MAVLFKYQRGGKKKKEQCWNFAVTSGVLYVQKASSCVGSARAATSRTGFGLVSEGPDQNMQWV